MLVLFFANGNMLVLVIMHAGDIAVMIGLIMCVYIYIYNNCIMD